MNKDNYRCKLLGHKEYGFSHFITRDTNSENVRMEEKLDYHCKRCHNWIKIENDN